MRISDWSSDVCSSDLSRGVILRRHVDLGPRIADRIDPLPLRLDLVAAHEQGLVALDEVEQQTLVSDAAACAGKAVRERDVHRHFLELHPVAVEARLPRDRKSTRLNSIHSFATRMTC